MTMAAASLALSGQEVTRLCKSARAHRNDPIRLAISGEGVR